MDHFSNRAASFAKRRLKQKKRRAHRNRHPNDNDSGVRRKKRADGEFEAIKVPKSFSLIENTEATVAFFHVLREQFKRGKNVFVDFENVEHASPEAVLVLVARLTDKRFTRKRRVRGAVPKNKEVQELLFELGFYKHLQSKYSALQNQRGLMLKRRSRKVEPDVAKEIIAFATRARFGSLKKSGGIYRVLIESMANTRDHASTLSKEVEPWWTCAYVRKSDSKVVFAFVDNGVGIFQSVKLQTFQQTWGPFLGFSSRGELLKNILNGTVGSRTGLSYRGKGLPGICDVQKRGVISNLVVLANDVIGLVDKDEFRTLTRSFSGTVICWEL